MINLIDRLLNKITMYRLTLYYLIALAVAASILSAVGVLPYSIVAISISLLILIVTSLISNNIFAWVFEAVPSTESVYLTALILFLIITPSTEATNLVFIFWAGVLATGSKYILAYRKKHFFNPAAIAVAITAFVTLQSASWWVGTASMLPIVILGGLLIVRKIQRFELVTTFMLAALATGLIGSLLSGSNLSVTLKHILLDSPFFFFAFVMLTEPQTTPPNKIAQVMYGAIVGFLFAPQINFLGIYSTPELALVLGNIFSYIVSPKMKVVLTLKRVENIAKDTYDFIFDSDLPFNFKPGQFLEWTVKVPHADDRGNRRWFTIASSPTEKEVRVGVKFYPQSSRFKQELADLKVGDKIVAGALSGNFVLSKNSAEKSVFIAGGIGVTPFRSIAKYLIDTNQKRDIILLYSNANVSEIAYTDIFNSASNVGLQAVYNLSTQSNVPANWQGTTGLITPTLIKNKIPDYLERHFYVSGPHAMVKSFEQSLSEIGIPKNRIITDYFPGFA